MSDLPQNNLPDAAREEILRRCRPEDFDGHTHFAALTAEQRLDWLDEAARFVAEFKGTAQTKPPRRQPAPRPAAVCALRLRDATVYERGRLLVG